MNVAVNLFDRYVDEVYFPTKDDDGWADSTWQTALDNLRGPWHLDQDCWLVNEIGHPAHGALYFTAARSNGLGFWPSSAAAAFGSFMWKIFGEVDDSNINDLITTTMGGMALGEMAHRLYRAASAMGSDAQYVLSPVDAANDALFGPFRSRDAAARPARLALSFQAGFVAPFLEPAAAQEMATGFAGMAGEVGEELVYGDPFSARSAPYDYFEERLDLELSPSFWGLTLFSDGTLFSIPLADSEAHQSALAGFLHYDFIYNSLVELEANAVGLGIVDRRIVRNGAIVSGELHLSALVLGTNENVYSREINGVQGLDEEGRDYDFCYGAGLKARLDVTQPRFGHLSLDYVAYGMKPYPDTTLSVAALDFALVGVLTAAYEHEVASHLSLGLAYTLYHKAAFYRSWPEAVELAHAVTLFTRLSL